MNGVHWQENGQSGFYGDALALHQGIDNALHKIALEMNAEPMSFGSFIDTQDLQKMDYLHSFPQHATFATNLCCHPENLEKFKNSEQFDSSGDICLTELTSVRAILTPAACYHLYIYLQNQSFDEGRIYTTVNQCFRREDVYTPLERQWSFKMREIVCVGSDEDVDVFCRSAQQKAKEFAAELGVPYVWENATDPFFNPQNNAKYLMQKIQPNKQEMVFDERLAIGSLNRHRNYFGEIFHIQCHQQPAFSSCLAFGIERWVAAIFACFGDDKKHWPRSIRELL